MMFQKCSRKLKVICGKKSPQNRVNVRSDRLLLPRLAIEPDGNFHRRKESQEYDRPRMAMSKEVGITVLRFWNEK